MAPVWIATAPKNLPRPMQGTLWPAAAGYIV